MTKYTFSDLLQKKCFDFCKIEIPLLQRDYVQGQKTTSDGDGNKINKTGWRFINAIFDSMKDNRPLDMDFIYGSVDGGNNFIPLDGQQRLTTLFLLHWYFANKNFAGNELEEKLAAFSHFSYETRVSSREFCAKLCDLKKRFSGNEIPSDYIRNEAWFFNKFNFDPTVKSMLNMLDVIHNLDAKYNVDYKKLSLLRFNILNIEKFGLTEELYLKMNARGKLLSDFEKIKAELEKKADDLDWEASCNEENKFYFKADGSWTDLFWKNFKPSIDEAFLNFIAEFMIVQLALKIENFESEDGKTSLRKIQEIAKNTENLSADDFDENSCAELKNCLNLYCKNENETKRPNLDLWDFCKQDDTLFSTVCKVENGAELTYQVRGIFFAQNLYLEKADKIGFDESKFNDWMRVIRNIAANATIDSVQTFRGFLNLILELSSGCDDIYQYLSTHTVESNFAKTQVQEEICKSKIILNSEKAKQLFSKLEENNFCNGRLYFAFYCCGIALEDERPTFDLKLFKKVKSIFETYFSKDDVSDDFRVLLFTCGNNKFYKYWESWSYRTKTVKQCCIESTSDLCQNFSRPETIEFYKDILKEAVLKLTEGKSIKDLLSEYKCPDSMHRWEKWIVKHPKEFSEHCSGHYFGVTPDGKTCYLYESYKRPNGREYCFQIPT